MNKSTWVSLAILFILVLVGLFYREGINDGEIKWKTEKKIIDKIIINRTEKTILLMQKNNVWQVGENGYLSDKVKIDNILTILTNERRFELVSSYTNSYSKYGLDGDNRIEVVGFMGDKEVRKLTIGDFSSSSYNYTYVIISDDSYVYQSSGDLRGEVDVEGENDFRDKLVLSFQKNELNSIEIIDSKGEKKTITKKTLLNDVTNTNQSPVPREIWVDEKDNELKKDKVNEMIDELSSLNADGFIDKSFDDYDKGEFIRKFMITTTSSRWVFFIIDNINKEDENKLECILEGIKTGFMISESQGEKLLVPYKELIE